MFIRLRMELTSSVMLASPWMVCLMALLATAKLIIWKPSKQFCHFQPQLVLQYYYVLEIGTTI